MTEGPVLAMMTGKGRKQRLAYRQYVKAGLAETDDEFMLEVAAPGMKKDDFEVNLENDVLTVSSESKEEAEEKEAAYTRSEFSYQSFQRTFTLPENMVDGDKIDAKYEDGILKLKLPKLEHAKKKPPRQITVS